MRHFMRWYSLTLFEGVFLDIIIRIWILDPDPRSGSWIWKFSIQIRIQIQIQVQGKSFNFNFPSPFLSPICPPIMFKIPTQRMSNHPQKLAHRTTSVNV